jgi:glucokinase
LDTKPLPARDESVIAVDIGGTTVKGVAFGPEGSVEARLKLPTFAVRDSAVDGLRMVIGRLVAAVGPDGPRAAGIGIACAGLVDAQAGVVKRAVNLSWTQVRLRACLEDEFGLPVALENDARAAALGEQAVRDSREPVRNFVFIPIGTGVSAAVVADGRLLRGAIGAAGELGHIPVVPAGRLCACGQRGCVEAYASGPSILAHHRELGGTLGSTAEIAAGIAADRAAGRAWADAVDALASGIITLTAVVDPAVVVLGGGVARAGAALLDPLGRMLASRLTWRAAPALSLSVLGPRAGLIGAGLLGWGTAGPDCPPGDFAANALAGLAAAADPVLVTPNLDQRSRGSRR